MRLFSTFWLTVIVMVALTGWRCMTTEDRREIKDLIVRHWWEPVLVFGVIWFTAVGLSAFSIKIL